MSTLWLSTEGTSGKYWQYQFVSAMKANKISVSVQTRGIASSTLQGSNDGSNWTDIADVGAIASSSEGISTKTVNFANSTKYQYYRYTGVPAGAFDNRYFFGMCDLQIYGRA